MKLFADPFDDFFGGVAPHWGAWIEISKPRSKTEANQSHPTGVRGLKCK